MTITEFLLARIAEDEGRLPNSKMENYTTHWYDCDYPGDMPGVCDCDLVPHMIADCDAKRAIVEACRPVYVIVYRESERLLASAFDQEHVKVEATSDPVWPHEQAEAILNTLAAVYADHPDYDTTWAA